MKFQFKKYFLILAILILGFTQSEAQTFGFGCLGLSGFYAGYSRQSFEFPGLNQYVNKQIESNINLQSGSAEQMKFQILTGYRIGANFFRAKFHSIFISAKGYYQFLKQQQQVSTQIQNSVVRQTYQVTMNHWGVGLDFGTKLFSVIDWKIVEGNVLFFNSDLTQEIFIDEVSQGQVKYSPDNAKVGYFLGTGLILQVVPDYISVEGTAGYNYIKIDKMNNSTTGTIPTATINQNIVDKGNFSVTLQLNIGFPL